MAHLDIRLNGFGAFGDIPPDKLAKSNEPIRIAALKANILGEGDPLVAIALFKPNGDAILTQTRLAMFLTAGDMFRDRYGDPRNGLAGGAAVANDAMIERIAEAIHTTIEADADVYMDSYDRARKLARAALGAI